MIMVVNQLFPRVIIVVIAILPFVCSSLAPTPSTLGDSVSDCNRNCPAGIGNGKRIPHPFGFSPGCQIQLNCSKSGEIKIGEFRVANVTEESILIDLPMNCSRPIEKLQPLFGRNYRMTSRNFLLLQNCTSPVNGCSIPIEMFKTRLGSVNCDSLNTSCYSYISSNVSFMDFSKLMKAGCRRVFSSIAAVDLNKENGNNSSWGAALSLEFQIVELEWWLEGNCVCGENAKCINVSGPGSVPMGYRCQCLEGYSGDGFETGDRCRKGEYIFYSKKMNLVILLLIFYISYGNFFILKFSSSQFNLKIVIIYEF